MKKTRIAALTFALGLSPLAYIPATHAQSDAAQGNDRAGTYQYERSTANESVPAQPATAESATLYGDTRAEPVIVEREPVTYTPREAIVVRPADDLYRWDARHPHWGQLHGRGLFNPQGPNDFGR